MRQRCNPAAWTRAGTVRHFIRHYKLYGSIFWGPMAVSVMGGLIAATLLTLFFLPALYVTGFRVKPA